jgi:predicted negative regulator of RcsB-dependent stress response
MNSERRHELQQNALADILGGQIKKVEPYTKLIAVGVAIAVFGGLAFGFYRSAEIGARSDATLELLQNSGSSDPEALAAVGDRYADTSAGTVAKLLQADVLLAEGISGLFNDREAAQGQLDEALKQYTLVAETSKDMLLRSRANFGVARTLESKGEIDKAVSAYNRVIEIGESDAIATAARNRINHLKSPMTTDFFAWFDKQDFTPPDPTAPPTLPSGVSLPDLPDLDLPDVSPLAVPAELKGDTTGGDAPGEMSLPAKDAAPAETPAPAESATPPADSDQPKPDAPAEEKPAATPPAEPAAPAEPEPAAPTEEAPKLNPPAEPAAAEPAATGDSPTGGSDSSE